ncbi:MAG TPA: hypothetical protein VKV24_08670 [Casimicrobiaceae bacterium]|nr:hypothetical protein [Casimicrobiaceae bacterium]
MALDLGGLLSRYLNVTPGQAAPDAEQHFDQVAQHASPQVLGQGISDALRSDATPALGQMVSQVFANADPNQRAGMLNQILASLPPGTLSSIDGGALGGLLGQLTSGSGTPQVTPQQASQVSPSQVQDLANHAEQHSDSVFDKLGQFYARNPQLVKTLGTAALTLAMANIAGRMRS